MKKKTKKVPATFFGMEIEYCPDAHRFSVAMAMVGLTTDIPSADLILRLYYKVLVCNEDMSISDAIELREEVTGEYAAIKEKFKKLNSKNK
jgi:hypothetical protein